MKLLTLPDERFTCAGCTNCCRNWHVELIAGEPERVRALPWPAGDPLAGAAVLLPHGGKTFLAHRPDGACVFLNPANGLCRVHEQFGLAQKPLGCRLYPFQIAPTSAGEATVAARYDCPAVRRNEGAPHAESLPELRDLARKLDLGPPPDEATRGHLDREQVDAVGEFLSTLLGAFADDRDRTLFLDAAATWLATQSADEIDRPALAKIFPVLREYVLGRRQARRPGLIHRLAFRALLGLYLRRDEDVLDGRANRAGRLIAMLRLVAGGGDLRALGTTHPPGPVRRARLFTPAMPIAAPDAFALHWRLVRNKLATGQYLGPAGGGRDVVAGLRSLAMLFPLVLATAKARAAGRGAAAVDATDVDHAVAAIEHSYGRQPAAVQSLVHRLERALGDPETFARLARTV